MSTPVSHRQDEGGEPQVGEYEADGEEMAPIGAMQWQEHCNKVPDHGDNSLGMTISRKFDSGSVGESDVYVR